MIEAYFCLRIFFSFSKSEGDYWIFSHSFSVAVRDINKAAIHAFFSSSFSMLPLWIPCGLRPLRMYLCRQLHFQNSLCRTFDYSCNSDVSDGVKEVVFLPTYLFIYFLLFVGFMYIFLLYSWESCTSLLYKQGTGGYRGSAQEHTFTTFTTLLLSCIRFKIY